MDSGTVFPIIFAVLMLVFCGGIMMGMKSRSRGKESERKSVDDRHQRGLLSVKHMGNEELNDTR